MRGFAPRFSLSSGMGSFLLGYMESMALPVAMGEVMAQKAGSMWAMVTTVREGMVLSMAEYPGVFFPSGKE